MISTRALLLASSAMIASVAAAVPASAASANHPIQLAQAAPPAASDQADPKQPPGAAKKDAAKERIQDKMQQRREQQAKPAPAAAPAQPSAAQASPQQPPAAQPKPQQPAAAQSTQPAPGAQPPQRAERDRQDRPRNDRAQQRDNNDRAQQRGEDRRPPAATAAQPAPAKPAETPPAAAQQKPATPSAPTAQQKPATPPAPTAQQQQPQRTPPAATAQPAPSTNPPAQQTPATAAQPAPQPGVAAAPQATQPRDAGEFIRRDGQRAGRGLDDLRRERRETREGNRTVIREGDRTIVREGDRTIIRHSEADRFAVGARDVRVDRRGNETVTVVQRPNGISIVTVTDSDGHLIRRVRRDRNGHEVVIIDNRIGGPRARDIFVELPPPVIRIPRDRYIVEAHRASPAQIYAVFTAPPVQAIEHPYTVEQVRYSAPLRERMPRVDLDITFDTGSWQLTPDQVDRLAAIAEGLNRAVDANPREVFLVEGHTDAVGSNEDNLSLSDRRAEAVAVALTEQFQVPPENLITQGYGEETLKVQTEGAERANRYVAVRRITPLIARAQTEGGSPRR